MKSDARARLSLILSGALCVLALTGCLRHENDPGQGGLTIGENKELDEAAAQLDARPKAPPPPAALTSTAPVQADEPAPQAMSDQSPSPDQQRPSPLGGIGRASQAKPAPLTAQPVKE